MSWLISLWRRVLGAFGLSSKSGFLCDDCKYNYGTICSRPDRPNATRCPDYKRR